MGFDRLIKKTYTNKLFTTPSHSQNFCIFNKFRHFYKLDVSETDTHNPEQMLQEAEIQASNIYGVKQTKFLTNGSSSGIIAAVLATTNKNDSVLIAHNAHQSHLNAVKLACGKPIFYELKKNNFGTDSAFPVEKTELMLKNRNIKALIITSPTYEGYISDIKEIKEICKKYGTYLIVDEAHGALYPFSEDLPDSAIKYADLVVQSLHKTAGGLNPTALLHSNCDVDISRALAMITTTSPSYPLLLSIEKNIKYLSSAKGRNELRKLISNLKVLRKLQGFEFGSDDITKILIKKEGLSGQEISEKLYKLGIEDERTNDISTLLITGIGTKKGKLDALKFALKKIYKMN